MTISEQRNFITNVIGDCLLDESIAWIQGNLAPEDVFGFYDLEGWAENNGYERKT